MTESISVSLPYANGSLVSAIGSPQTLEKSRGFWETLTEMSFLVRSHSFLPENEIQVHETPGPEKAP